MGKGGTARLDALLEDDDGVVAAVLLLDHQVNLRALPHCIQEAMVQGARGRTASSRTVHGLAVGGVEVLEEADGVGLGPPGGLLEGGGREDALFGDPRFLTHQASLILVPS